MVVEEGWPCSILSGTPTQSLIEKGFEVFAVDSVHDDAAQERNPPTKGLVSSFLVELAIFELGLILGPLMT